MAKKKKNKKKDKKKLKVESKVKVSSFDDPLLLEVKGQAMIGSMISLATEAGKGDHFFKTPLGIVRLRANPQENGTCRLNWQLNNKQIPKTTLSASLKDGDSKKSIKKQAKEQLLLTEKQLQSKYLVEKLHDRLELNQFGKKKMRKKLKEILTKKKVKGKMIVDKMQEVFGEIPMSNFFLIFSEIER